MAHMVVSTGVHAAGYVEFDGTQIELIIQGLEALLKRLRHGDGFGVRQRAEVAAGAADQIRDAARVRGGQTQRLKRLPQRLKLALADIGEHDVLFVGGAQFAEGVGIGQLGQRVHLRRADISGDLARGLQGNGHRAIPGLLVVLGIAFNPGGEERIARAALGEKARFCLCVELGVVRRAEVLAEGGDCRFGQGIRPAAGALPLRVHGLPEGLGAQGFNQDFDARLVFVVAAPAQVVHAQDGL